MNIISKVLQWLAAQLDKWIPGKGARTMTLIILSIIGNVSMYLTGAITLEQAATNIAQAFAVIFVYAGSKTTTPTTTPK